MLPVNRATESVQIGLGGCYSVGRAQAQDFLIFLLDDLLFIVKVLPELVKGILDVLHVLFDSLHVDTGRAWLLLGAMVSLGSHRRAAACWKEVITVATLVVEERRLHTLGVLVLTVVEL